MQLRPPATDDHNATGVDRIRELTASFVTANRMRLVVVAMTSIWLAVSWIVFCLERGAPHATITSFGRALWWGVVTFMTVGYGDMIPVTPWGRGIAVVMMFAGVTTTGIITAKISTYFLRQILLEGRGAVDKSKVKNHVIICGWKEDMPDLVGHIMLLNPTLKSRDLVIIANRDQETVAAFRASSKRLADVHVIIGEHFHQATLVRAAPEVARKVLILADTSPGPDGRKPTATEADARTVMTAIALGNVAKGTLVAAEILDPSLDSYLKLAGVAEIIYTREYSRLILGSASSGTGLTNVLHDLIDPRSGANLTTADIPERFVDKTYREFRDDFESRFQDRLLIGILENAGNPHSMKALAFQEAQKTPSVPRLIDNLRTVKTLRCNNPVFHPRGDFRIPKGSSAIVLNTPAHTAATQLDEQASGENAHDQHIVA